MTFKIKLLLGVVFIGVALFLEGWALYSVLSIPPQLEYINRAETFYTIPILSRDAYTYLKEIPQNPSRPRFIFLRHGEAISTREMRRAGRTVDVDLSDLGIEQALEVGRQLKEVGIAIQAFYSSPLKRTDQTASCVLEQLTSSSALIYDERLYEKFYGPYEGASYEDYQTVLELEEANMRGVNKSFEEKFAYKAHPDMESLAEVHERAMSFMQGVALQHENEHVFVVTHNAVIKALFMADAAERGYTIDYHAFRVENCAMLVVEVDEEGMHVVATKGLEFKN